MKITIAALLILFASSILRAQSTDGTTTHATISETQISKAKDGGGPHPAASKNPKPPIIYRGFGLTPVERTTTIKGLAFGMLASPTEKATTLTIKGLNIEPDPLPVLGVPQIGMQLLMSLFAEKHTPEHDIAKVLFAFPKKDTDCRATIKGVSITTGSFDERAMKGVVLNALIAMNGTMSGLEVSGLINEH